MPIPLPLSRMRHHESRGATRRLFTTVAIVHLSCERFQPAPEWFISAMRFSILKANIMYKTMPRSIPLVLNRRVCRYAFVH
jgi:hypothetical protein